MATEHPRLRPLHSFTHNDGEREMLCLRDPSGLTNKIMAISMSALPLLQLLNGRHSVEEIEQLLARTSDEPVSIDLIRKFIDQLDEAYLLDSPRFHALRKQRIEEYRQQPVRPAAHAGVSYPDKASEIHTVFNHHFDPPAGPGPNASPSRPQPPNALVIPHIDPRHGGPTYAWAYNELRHTTPRIDTFIILGVGHAPTRHRFVATRKDFQTPLGLACIDHPLLDATAQRLPFDLFADEFIHAREHSIEFQAVYLQHVLGENTPFRIVPILVGSFRDLLNADADPVSDPQVLAFCNALEAAVATKGKRVCVIASVDLAHVGQRFGDEFTVNHGVLSQLEAEDRSMLRHLELLRPRDFWRFICEEHDRRRVDGYPAIYTLLRALSFDSAKLLHYAQHHEKENNSVVTYASMAFYRNSP